MTGDHTVTGAGAGDARTERRERERLSHLKHTRHAGGFVIFYRQYFLTINYLDKRLFFYFRFYKKNVLNFKNIIFLFFIVKCLRTGLQEALLEDSCDKLYLDY